MLTDSQKPNNKFETRDSNNPAKHVLNNIHINMLACEQKHNSNCKTFLSHYWLGWIVQSPEAIQ